MDRAVFPLTRNALAAARLDRSLAWRVDDGQVGVADLRGGRAARARRMCRSASLRLKTSPGSPR